MSSSRGRAGQHGNRAIIITHSVQNGLGELLPSYVLS